MDAVGVLNALHQDLKGAAAQHFDGLPDGGQRDGAEVCIKAVIITDERDISGNGQTTLSGSFLYTDGDKIAESENGGHILPEQLQCTLETGIDLILAVMDQGIVKKDVVVGQNLPEAFKTVLIANLFFLLFYLMRLVIQKLSI